MKNISTELALLLLSKNMGINTSLPTFLSGKPSKQSHRFSKFRNKNKLQNVDHNAMDEVNLLMDKWRPSDVLILMRKFKIIL